MVQALVLIVMVAGAAAVVMPGGLMGSSITTVTTITAMIHTLPKQCIGTRDRGGKVEARLPHHGGF